MHILFTVLFTFLIELREENLLKYQDILSVLIIPFIHSFTNVNDSSIEISLKNRRLDISKQDT